MLDDKEPVLFKWYPPAPGFQPGDGEKVASTFSAAKVTEGSLPSTYVKEFLEGGAGPRSAIGCSSLPPGGAAPGDMLKPQHTWVSKKFSSPAAARTAMDKIHDVWSKTTGNTWSGGFMRVNTSLEATSKVLELTTKIGATELSPEYRMTSFTRIVLYRDQFILGYTLQQPTLDHDFSAEDRRILQRSKELIDLRFPVR